MYGMDSDRIQVAFQTRMGEQMIKMTSTLVETVSINYEDFNESFLTCGTCLCTYDAGEHTPKLLPCSHTVCLHCLGRIAATSVPTTAYSVTPVTASTSAATAIVPPNPSFRCPICRELIYVPRGGVVALPPSFLVNQLLDLMASQRREIIPKCSIHSAVELLFCESCDAVFCSACKSSPHNTTMTGSHNVIPFAVAIKRLSEILRSKVTECVVKLNEAEENITEEMTRLECAENSACVVVNQAFEEAVKLLEKRRQSYISKIRDITRGKLDTLRGQIDLIEKEKVKVRESCDGLEYQVEVRHITKRISELSQQLDSFSSLKYPRENAYLLCKTQSDLNSLETAVLTDIHTSNTYPPLCTLNLKAGSLLSVGIEVEVILETRDYNDDVRKVGGDPVVCRITTPAGGSLPENSVHIEDNEDGTYSIIFIPTEEGEYKVHIDIFGRQIRDDNFAVEISQHNNPLRVWGKGDLCQPVSCARSQDGEIFVLDIGNARVVVLDQSMAIKRILENETLQGRSCTGIAYVSNSNSVIVVNWRSKEVTRLSPIDGSTLSKFTYNGFEEPIGLCADRKGNIFVADNGARSVFAFDVDGNFKYAIKKEKFSLLGGIAVGYDDQTLVVADTSLYMFNGDGKCEQEITVPGKGRFGGVCVDDNGVIIACRTEKNRSFIQIFKHSKLVSVIDSFTSKLRRPSDITLINSKHVLVVDLGNECIKQYRYK